MLGEGPTYGINRSFALILVKQTQNLAWVCIIMVIIVICLLMEKKSFSLKLIIKMLIFQFSLSSGFGATESREASLKGNEYDLPVDYNVIDKSDILILTFTNI